MNAAVACFVALAVLGLLLFCVQAFVRRRRPNCPCPRCRPRRADERLATAVERATRGH